IWLLKMPVIVPWRSGLHHTCPSDHWDNARSSATLGWSAGTLSGSGSPCGSKMRVSAPRRCRMRAASSVSSRLYERSRSEPYSNRMRGGWPSSAGTPSFSWVGMSSKGSSSAGNEASCSAVNCFMMLFSRRAGSAHTFSLFVYDHFTIFLGERPSLSLIEDIERQFGRPAQPHAFWRHDKGAVDENGMCQHGIEQGIVRKLGVVQTKLLECRLFLAQRLAYRQART